MAKNHQQGRVPRKKTNNKKASLQRAKSAYPVPPPKAVTKEAAEANSQVPQGF